MNPYETLGVGKSATPDAIKRAYKRKAKLHHPDRGGSSEAMSKINQAYRLLRDESARDQYDRTGETNPKREPTVEEMAAEGLATIAINWCRLPKAPEDFKGAMQAALRHTLDEAKKEHAIAETTVRRINKVLNKLKRKSTSTLDPILDEFRKQLPLAKEGLRQSQRKLDSVECALKMLAGYTMEKDPAIALTPYSIIEQYYQQPGLSGRPY